MLSLLLALQIVQSPGDTIMAAARRAVATVTDTASARANGFVPLSEVRLVDRTPFQGEHWISMSRFSRDTTTNVSLGEPAFVMFGPVNGKAQRVGIAYLARMHQGVAGPTGLGGDAAAQWHTHQFCGNVPGQGRIVIADNAKDCVARGGSPGPRQVFMVHVWTDVPNPEGIYGHDNPALPFLAVGLKPPGVHDMHDTDRAHKIRELAMAIGETYDARMPVSRRIEQIYSDAAQLDSLRMHRAAIAAPLPALKAADAAGKTEEYERVATKMISEWEALVRLYERMAPTDELRALVKRENEDASTHSH